MVAAKKRQIIAHKKPIECMAKPIRNNSAKGELICDPFLGSGTTLIAAEQLNRTCYGMEIEPLYCQMIIDRFRKHSDKEIRINGEPIDGENDQYRKTR